MEKKFRLPRKIKKLLKNKFLLYRHNQGKLSFIVANPSYFQEDYDAYKKGQLISVFKLSEELELAKKLKENA